MLCITYSLDILFWTDCRTWMSTNWTTGIVIGYNNILIKILYYLETGHTSQPIVVSYMIVIGPITSEKLCTISI
jgi:hypothetical protein